jgi:hypothetical protein
MTNTEGRAAHFNGEHNVADATPEERIRWAAECAYCARIAAMEGLTVRATPSRVERSYSAPAPRVPQGGSYNNGGRIVRPATEAQVKFVKSLLASRDLTNTIYDGWVPDNYTGGSGSAKASEMIDYLKPLPWKKTAPKAAPAAQVTEDGMYQDPEGVIYKVQIAKQGSGNLYAKRLIVEEGQGHFEYAAGAIRIIKPEWKMTLEQAAEFGSLYGVCCKCGAALTDEESIARGIGPICAQSF